MLGLGEDRHDIAPTVGRKLKIGNLRPDDWIGFNSKMEEFLVNRKYELNHSVKPRNPTRFLDILQTGLQAVLAKCYRKAGNKAQPQEQSPIQLFCKRNIDHPDYPKMISALKERRVPQTGEKMGQMSRDG